MILTMSPGLNSMKAIDLAVELAAKKNVQNIIPREKLFIDRGCVHWSKMTGKMYGKRAIGRPMTPKCASNKKIPGSICSYCYAEKTNKVYPNMAAALLRNRELEAEDIYSDSPIFTDVDLTWRSNWNGDYRDEHDVMIDFTLCEVLNYATCTAWTKNFEYVEAMSSERPDNFTLMQSSLMVNQVDENISPEADQVFTVYTAEFAAENDININCMGACRLCGRCYGKKKRIFEINELLKGDEIKYLKLMGLDL